MAELDEITEQAKVEAELARLKQAQPPTPPDDATIGLPPTVEEEAPKVIVQPETEEPKPPEPVAPPEPKPAERSKADRDREGDLYRQLREARREIEQLRQAQQPPVTKPAEVKEPTYEEDPAEFLRRRDEKLEKDLQATQAEIQRLRGERAQSDQQNAVQRTEEAFAREHPDYYDAVKHLETQWTNLWEVSGFGAAQVRDLRQRAEAGRLGNPAFKPVDDHLRNISNLPEIRELAEKEGRDPEDVAAWAISRDQFMQGERMKVIAGATETGRNVAALAYDMAQRIGYQTKTARPTQANGNDAARQRVLQARQISEATRSLSETATGEGAAPGPKVIRNRDDVLALDEDELDALITSGKYRNL